ncbi:MAG TPA: ATP-dependent protease ATPase subunit HslU [bacterium]|nr:ATP-dependent protease ATPase subunit HslU [bacterium]
MKEKDYKPKEIVAVLDRYIVGQQKAKRAVAVALRNRIRRQRLPAEMQDEVTPKNILMIGPTGVGKTEIARRLAKIVKAPFIKVEASKYTEVGYVGRDVESMIRDLAKISVNMVREEHMAQVKGKAGELAEERLVDLLVPPLKQSKKTLLSDEEIERSRVEKEQFKETREKMRVMLKEGKLEERFVEVPVAQKQAPMMEVFSGGSMDEIGINMQEMFEGLSGNRTKKKRVSVKEARDIIGSEEMQKLIDMDRVVKEAVRRAENNAIIFIDEIDKVAGREKGSGPDVSREGVQRDILPVVEGTTVITRYGPVRTDHILFIAAGAFHISKPSDLIPELQGRFPIRVELDPLTKDDFERILSEPENSLIKQYTALLDADSVRLVFEKDAVPELAAVAYEVNEKTENIGARRLHTIIEKVLEDYLFEAPYEKEETRHVDREYIRGKLEELVKDRDLSRYIL